MGLIDTARKALGLSRSAVLPPWPVGIDDYQPWPHLLAGQMYGVGIQTSMPNQRIEDIGTTYDSLVGAGFAANGIVFACEMKRVQIFSQARFLWQSMRKGQADSLFGTPALGILEKPWPSGTTGDLLTKMLTHADFGGNAFVVRRGNQLRCLRPSWVDMVLGSYDDPNLTGDDIDAEFLGIVYYPGGKYAGAKGEAIPRSEIAHFAPIPDPSAHYRGMSWMTPIIREVMGDQAMTTHKLKFHENAGTPNLVVKRQDTLSKESFQTWVQMMEQGHRGAANAYKTLYLDSGSDATVVGADLRALDFKVVQGAGETRMAAAAGVHPVLVGLSEGMQGAALNAGNFNSARRSTADTTMWHLWGNAAGSLEAIIPPPGGARLWIDPDMPFLREDRKDAAEIKQIRASTLNTYLTAGYTPQSAVKALVAEDETLLTHSGLLSVQLQEPGTTKPEPTPPTAPTNGTGKEPAREAQLHFHFEDGAFRSSPVTVNNEAPVANFAEGMVRIDAPVTVEPSPVTIAEGAVRVESPVSVEPANVTIAEGAVRVDSPITVERTEVTVEPAAVTIAEGALHVDPPPPAEVTVNLPAPKPTRKTVKRDKAGRITEVTEE